MIEKKKENNTIHRFKPLLTLIVIILCLALFFKLGFFSSHSPVSSGNEIAEIKATNDLQAQIKLYKELILRVGPAEAQEDLYRSGLPFTGQTHLLNHTIGDYLYTTYGPAGLTQCRDYFLSSCYHGFILHAISDGGMAAVAKSFDACRALGPTVYTQCAHAIGHGFLANVGYKELPQALATCDEAEKTMSGFPVFNCYDGVFMENVWGVHDGTPSPDRWVKPEDPVYPCNSKNIDDKYILACWSNQPSLDYGFFGGNIKKIADVCLDIKNPQYMQMCFDGLSRQIHPIANGSVAQTLNLCGQIGNTKWTGFCESVNAGASYSVGDRTTPFGICSAVPESNKSDCFNRVFSMMHAYQKPTDNFKTMCLQITDLKWQTTCNSTFLQNQ